MKEGSQSFWHQVQLGSPAEEVDRTAIILSSLTRFGPFLGLTLLLSDGKLLSCNRREDKVGGDDDNEINKATSIIQKTIEALYFF